MQHFVKNVVTYDIHVLVRSNLEKTPTKSNRLVAIPMVSTDTCITHSQNQMYFKVDHYCTK